MKLQTREEKNVLENSFLSIGINNFDRFVSFLYDFWRFKGNLCSL